MYWLIAQSVECTYCAIYIIQRRTPNASICTVYFEIYSAHFLTCLSSTMYSKYMLQYTVAQEAHIYMLHIIHRGYSLHCLAWQCIGQKSACLSPWRIISCRCSRPIPGAWGRYPGHTELLSCGDTHLPHPLSYQSLQFTCVVPMHCLLDLRTTLETLLHTKLVIQCSCVEFTHIHCRNTISTTERAPVRWVHLKHFPS